MNTQAWLNSVWIWQRSYIATALEATPFSGDYKIPLRSQLSIGFSPRDGRGRQPQALCYPLAAVRDGKTHTVFISPRLAGSRQHYTLLAVMLHEQIHAWTAEWGHGPKFKRLASLCGLRPPHPYTTPKQLTSRLRRELRLLHDTFGPCPWVPLLGG